MLSRRALKSQGMSRKGIRQLLRSGAQYAQPHSTSYTLSLRPLSEFTGIDSQCDAQKSEREWCPRGPFERNSKPIFTLNSDVEKAKMEWKEGEKNVCNAEAEGLVGKDVEDPQIVMKAEAANVELWWFDGSGGVSYETVICSKFEASPPLAFVASVAYLLLPRSAAWLPLARDDCEIP